MQILAALPASVTSLNLTNNDLYSKTAEELVQILAAIPKSVKYIDLEMNRLSKFGEVYLLSMLPLHVHMVKIDSGTFDLNAYWTEHLLEQLHKALGKTTIPERLEAIIAIKLPFEISEKRMARYITILEKSPKKTAPLLCALLLDYQQINTISAPETLLNAAYMEKRAHDAISFYGKAAHHPPLKPLISCILWEIKTVTSLESIRSRLEGLPIEPPNFFSHSWPIRQEPPQAPLLRQLSFFTDGKHDRSLREAQTENPLNAK